MVLRLWSAGPGHRVMCRHTSIPRLARCRHCAAAGGYLIEPTRASDLDRASIRAVLAAARRYHVHHDGHCRRTAALGGAVDPVFTHLHPRLRAAAAFAPFDHGAGVAVFANFPRDLGSTWPSVSAPSATDVGDPPGHLLRRL